MSYKSMEFEVLKILRDVESSRNSDRILLYSYFKKKYNIDLSWLFEVEESLESITRARRKIQQRGSYTADENIRTARKEKEKEFKGWLYDLKKE